jgi:hypothetical protein
MSVLPVSAFDPVFWLHHGCVTIPLQHEIEPDVLISRIEISTASSPSGKCSTRMSTSGHKQIHTQHLRPLVALALTQIHVRTNPRIPYILSAPNLFKQTNTRTSPDPLPPQRRRRLLDLQLRPLNHHIRLHVPRTPRPSHQPRRQRLHLRPRQPLKRSLRPQRAHSTETLVHFRITPSYTAPRHRRRPQFLRSPQIHRQCQD